MTPRVGVDVCASLLLGLVALLLAPAVEAEHEPPPTTVDALLAVLDTGHERTARLGRILQTLPGRAALNEAADHSLRVRDRKVRREGLRRVSGQLGDPDARPWWVARAKEWAGDVASVERVVAYLRKSLAGDDVLTGDLRAFLAREDAARVLYSSLVRPLHRPHALQGAISACFATDDAGKLFVPSVLRVASDRALARDRSAVQALEQLRAGVPGLQSEEWDDVALVVLLHAAGGFRDDPVETATGLVRELTSLFSSDEMDKPFPLRVEADRSRGDVEETLRLARAYAARLSDDAALEPWRSLLGSPRALLLSPGGRIEQGKPVDLLWNRTGFGRALVKEKGGKVRINPHARWDLDLLLGELREDADEEAELAEPAVATAALLEEGAVRDALRTPAGRELLVEAATWEGQGVAVEALAAWIDDVLVPGPGGLRVSDAGTSALDGLLERVPKAKRELAAGVPGVVLDPGGLAWQKDGLELLRSSVFYNPRTRYGHRVYVTEFEDHHSARLFGTFGWNAQVSKNLADFKQRIRSQKVRLQRLARIHDKLIVPIGGVPPWLSSWKGTGRFEAGGWEDKQTHLPKDVEVWKQMIRELALVFREVEGVERYYEFWNEPDLEYWQGTLEDFLALYEATASTIREIDPQGKIGGCAVNQWDGRIHGDRGSDVLVHELIRFAARRKLPLDFVSWHHFGRPVSAIAEAKASYAAELSKHGFGEKVEYLVTEWSAPWRGAPAGNVAFAESMLGFFHAVIDAQTASCWEEFHAKPDPGGFAPWGLMTQQGEKHGTWYVHRFFDRLARGSRGVAVQRIENGPVTVVSRKDDGVHDILVWRAGTPPGVKAAWEVLREAGFGREDGRSYGTVDRFELALRDGGPAEARFEEAFAEASEAWRASASTERLRLEIKGAASVEVLFAESVRTKHETKRVAVLGNVLTCPLERNEVLRLTIRVRDDPRGSLPEEETRP